MKKFIVFLILLFAVNNTLISAQPSDEDNSQAEVLLYTLTSDQELHFRETSNYESVHPTYHENGLITHSCAYSNFVGKGYIATVSKVEEGKIWVIQEHVGQDPSKDSYTHTSWTCMNCNEENYEIFQEVNEHGLCNV